MIVTEGLTKRYGKTWPSTTSASRSRRASSPASSARTVRASPPRCGWSWASTLPTPAGPVNGVRYDELRWPLREVGALLDAKAFHPGRSARNHLRCLARTNEIPDRRGRRGARHRRPHPVADQRAGRFSLGMGQRLGIASALLGDPGVLLFDEPVNGLDPEGIRWARHLLRDLAGEGRTVLVSSHLINEMALTAERLVVIGRGTLIAETSVDDFVALHRSDSVRIVTPTPQRFVSALSRAGARPGVDSDGAIVVTGLSSSAVGELAANHELTLHELIPVRASLEDVFMDLTSESVEYRSHVFDPVVDAECVLDPMKGLRS